MSWQNPESQKHTSDKEHNNLMMQASNTFPFPKSYRTWEPLSSVWGSNLAVFYNKQVYHALFVTTKQKIADHALYTL
jgi:hypothetical protein